MVSSKSTRKKNKKFAMIAFRVSGTRSRLQCFDQGNSVGGNAQPLTGKAQMFLGSGLHTHSVHRQAEGIGQILAHGRNVRRKLGPLTQQRRVDIFNAEAVLL